MLLLIVKLNRDFHRAGDIKRSDGGIYLPDDDYAGVGNLLAIVAIEDGHVRTRRPINHLANFVSVGSFSLFRNRARQMSEFFSAEQIVHRHGERQQGDKIPRGFTVDQRGGHFGVLEFQSYLHTTFPARGSFRPPSPPPSPSPGGVHRRRSEY